MCVCVYRYLIKMTSKTISITKEVYQDLIKIKGKKESFSQLFIRILRYYKPNIKESFGKWDLSKEEKIEIWDKLTERSGRRWSGSDIGELR